MRDLYTRALYKISSQDLYGRSLYKSSLQDLFKGPHMRHLYTRSPDIPGLSRSPHRSSLQDPFTSPIWNISIQDLLASLDLLGLFTGALYKISSQDRYERSLYKSSLQDLFTRPLWEISIQELSTRSLHKTSMRDLFRRALCKIFSQDLYERSLYKSSLQDLFTRPLWEIPIQDLLISLDLWDLLTTRSLQKTSIRIQHAESTERVARTKSKSAPRYSESDPTRTNSAKNAPGWAPATFHQQNEHGATARAIRHAQSPERVAFANIKSAPRHSEIQKIRVPTAPWRQNYNTKCDFSMFCDASTAPATKKWVRGIRSDCHAKWCQHSRSKFDDSFTKRAFRALQDRLQEHQILRLPRKKTIFHHLQFRATLTTILHTSQNPHVLRISGFPKIDTARRRERTSEMDLVGAPSRAGEMQIFDLEGTFQREGCQISRRRRRTPPIYTRCFSLTVRTP